MYCDLRTYLTLRFRQCIITTNILKKGGKNQPTKQTKKKPLELEPVCWSDILTLGRFNLLRKCRKTVFFILFIQHVSCQWGILWKLRNCKLKGKYAFPKTRCGSQESINSTIWKNIGPMPANIQINKVFMASRKKLETWRGVRSLSV